MHAHLKSNGLGSDPWTLQPPINFFMKLNSCCRPRDAAKAKYDLKTTLRTQMGAEDEAFQCMGEGEDAEGRSEAYNPDLLKRV